MATELRLFVPMVVIEIVAGGCCTVPFHHFLWRPIRWTLSPVSTFHNSILNFLATDQTHCCLRTYEVLDDSFDSARSCPGDPCPT